MFGILKIHQKKRNYKDYVLHSVSIYVLKGGMKGKCKRLTLDFSQANKKQSNKNSRKLKKVNPSYTHIDIFYP